MVILIISPTGPPPPTKGRNQFFQTIAARDLFFTSSWVRSNPTSRQIIGQDFDQILSESSAGIMDLKVGLLFLLVLGATGWFSAARELAGVEIFGTSTETTLVSDSSVADEDSFVIVEVETGTPGEVIENNQVCTLCEEFAAQAIGYLGDNKTQTEIINTLHESCSHLPPFKEQCVTLVDYYAPLFFMEVSSIQPEDFCRKVNLCLQKGIWLSQIQEDSCDICQHAVSEVLIKLKDPDTQLEIIEVLLKGCNSMNSYAQKCKKLVFEYGPLILANAEQFLEKTDICTMLHACPKQASLLMTDS